MPGIYVFMEITKAEVLANLLVGKLKFHKGKWWDAKEVLKDFEERNCERITYRVKRDAGHEIYKINDWIISPNEWDEDGKLRDNAHKP
jgi:hypothetical protein